LKLSAELLRVSDRFYFQSEMSLFKTEAT